MTALLASAMQFVPRDRAEALFRKWLRRDMDQMPEDRAIAMAADAVLLSADLLIAQPSAGGTTALDRLARSIARAPAAEAAALAALRAARFRLLRLEGDARADEVAMRDAISHQALRIVGAELPQLTLGTMLFARVAVLEGDLACLPSAITPLDAAASTVARGHAAAGAPGLAAGARWAEALYAHVVRHGTLDVPGLNRPRAGVFAEDATDEIEALAGAWAALAGGQPDAELLRRTRQMATQETIIDMLAGCVITRDEGHHELSAAIERLLLVQLETVSNRQRSGSGKLSLDAVARAAETAIGAGELPSEARPLLTRLRQLVSPGPAGAHEPGLERLVQRIQGLRAKTVAQGCTEQEAMAAAEKVAELLDRYGLSLGELEFRAQPCDGIGIQTSRRRFAPIDSCIPGIAAFFDCRVWVEQERGAPLRYIFFGLRGEVTAAQYLYEMVERAFEAETDVFRASALYAEMAGERRSATNSFQTGLARGISDKLLALRAARDAHRRSERGRDLVPVKTAMVDEELARLGLDLRPRGLGGRKRVLSDPFEAGQAAGQRFEFMPGIARAA